MSKPTFTKEEIAAIANFDPGPMVMTAEMKRRYQIEIAEINSFIGIGSTNPDDFLTTVQIKEEEPEA